MTDPAGPRLLPRVRTREEYLASPRDQATYLPAIAAICQRHRLPGGARSKFAGGSTIVFSVGDDHVVKLFEPIFHRAAEIEEQALARVHGELPVPTPAVVATGELEGWRYVVMERLRGEPLPEVWRSLAPGERSRLCAEVGEAVAGLHQLSTRGLSALPADWADFLARQAAGCMEQQRERGLADEWLRQIPEFLERCDLRASAPGPALLHTEIMRDHLLVRPTARGWRVSGLFDFEPAMIGSPEYELASVGIFLTGAEPGLFRAFLRGYGRGEAELTPELQRRIMAYALLHRYSNLRWYLETLPPRTATTLPQLAAEWWGYG